LAIQMRTEEAARLIWPDGFKAVKFTSFQNFSHPTREYEIDVLVDEKPFAKITYDDNYQFDSLKVKIVWPGYAELMAADIAKRNPPKRVKDMLDAELAIELRKDVNEESFVARREEVLREVLARVFERLPLRAAEKIIEQTLS
jgi:hypothetical protein